MKGKAVVSALLTIALAAGAALGQGGGLTPEAVKNGRFFSELFENKRWVQLKNGVYSLRQEDDILDIRLINGALGDLNGDGAGDAAVILSTNTGGSGSFIELAAVINEKGQPRHVASEELGDRVKVEKIVIHNGVITLNLVVHGPEDPSCCPTRRTTMRFKLQGTKLVQQ